MSDARWNDPREYGGSDRGYDRRARGEEADTDDGDARNPLRTISTSRGATTNRCRA